MYSHTFFKCLNRALVWTPYLPRPGQNRPVLTLLNLLEIVSVWWTIDIIYFVPGYEVYNIYGWTNWFPWVDTSNCPNSERGWIRLLSREGAVQKANLFSVLSKCKVTTGYFKPTIKTSYTTTHDICYNGCMLYRLASCYHLVSFWCLVCAHIHVHTDTRTVYMGTHRFIRQQK